MRYQAKPFNQLLRQNRRSGESLYKTLYAVWDWKTGNYVIEDNGLVAVNPNIQEVKIWAKYLNDNLPYETLLSDKPFSQK